MSRYIDADTLIRKIQDGHKFGSLTITELISECPTADVVEVVHGEWKKTWSSMCREYLPTCSNCNKKSPLKYKYCPFCGARMDGGR